LETTYFIAIDEVAASKEKVFVTLTPSFGLVEPERTSFLPEIALV
jgi:hypothetical protein